VLSALIYLPDWAVIAFGIVLIVGHNLFDNVMAISLGKLGPLWTILHAPGFLVTNPQHTVFVAYPLIPWVGVTAAGYGLGQIFSWSPERRQPFLLRLGLGLTAAFLAIRAVNHYGDPFPWSAQKSAAFTVLSFLNTTKYPPSWLFLLMTLGPSMLLVRAFDKGSLRFLHPALIYGRVPMFYYILHPMLIHLVALLVCYAKYGEVHWMFESPDVSKYPISPPPGWGLSLPVIYLIWIFVVIALYPACRWFAGVKQRHTDPWLGYL